MYVPQALPHRVVAYTANGNFSILMFIGAGRGKMWRGFRGTAVWTLRHALRRRERRVASLAPFTITRTEREITPLPAAHAPMVCALVRDRFYAYRVDDKEKQVRQTVECTRRLINVIAWVKNDLQLQRARSSAAYRCVLSIALRRSKRIDILLGARV